MEKKFQKEFDKNKNFTSFKSLFSTVKKRFFNSRKKIIINLIVFFAVILVVFFFSKYFTQGATFGWIQTDWSGGATTNTANHEDNQVNWNEYANKSEGINTSVAGEISAQNTNPEEKTYTTNGDFGNGTTEGVNISNDELILIVGGFGT